MLSSITSCAPGSDAHRRRNHMTAHSPSESISVWLKHLKGGDATAAQKLWKRYADSLLKLAKRRVSSKSQAVADEEDILQDVFASLCRGAAEGRFEQVQNRDELWWLLLALTQRKAADQARREGAKKRGRSQTVNVSDIDAGGADHGSFQLLVSGDPTPEFAAQLAEGYQRLLALLRDDTLRMIATLRVEGYAVAEIAERTDVSVRSVERKLKLIRATWGQELESQP